MKADLKMRWESEPGRAFIDMLSRWGRSGNGYEIKESPFGMVADSGLLDVRGLTLPDLTELRRITFRSADFTGAVFKRTRLELSVFSDSSFDTCSLRSIAELGDTFENCSFRKANFRDAVLGYMGSRFRRCVFEQTDFIQTGFIRPEFDDSLFDSCRFSGADFNGGSFERCEFRGEMRGVWFRGGFPAPAIAERWGTPRPNTMTSVSFQKAKLIDATFSNQCDLSSVVPPDDGRHALFDRWPERIKAVFEQSRGWPEPCREAAEVFSTSHEGHARTQDWYLVGLDDLMNQHGKDSGQRVWQALLTSP